MSTSVIAAVLFAALMHAGWNILVKRHARTGSSGASTVPTVLVVAGSGLLCALGLPFVAAPAPASWPFIAASALVQTVYYRLLTETYRSGDLSHAYPLMRGCAPPIVALAGMLMGERLGGAQWLALGLVCGGVLGIFVDASRAAPAARRTTLLALATACVIATYTLIDGAGVRRSDAPAGYTMWIFVATAVVLTALEGRSERRVLLTAARRQPLILLGGGAMSAASYGIALWAMTRAPVALVAALRETSILFATAIAVLVLRERVSRGRLLAVALIACGAAMMRLA